MNTPGTSISPVVWALVLVAVLAVAVVLVLRRSNGSGPPASTIAFDHPGDRSVPLADPGLPVDDLTQVVHRQLVSGFLTHVVYGPGTAVEVFEVVSQALPGLITGGRVHPEFGFLDGSEQTPWVVLEGAAGSALAMFALPGADLNSMMTRSPVALNVLPAPWRWTIGTQSNRWNPRAAAVVDAARAIPNQDLLGLLGPPSNG